MAPRQCPSNCCCRSPARIRRRSTPPSIPCVSASDEAFSRERRCSVATWASRRPSCLTDERVLAASVRRSPGGGSSTMRFRLIPRDEGFFQLFSEAAVNIDEGAKIVAELLAELSDIEARVSRLVEIEHQGDVLT